MAGKSKPDRDNPKQSEEFIKVAKELEADESGADFDRALSVIAPASNPPIKPEKPPAKRGRPPKEPAD